MLITKYLLIHNLGADQSLLINSLSGAMDIVDDKTKEFLESGGKTEIDENTFVQLKERFYIFEDEEEEHNFFNSSKRFLEIMHPKKANTLCILCPTYSCNLRCTYCFQAHEMHKSDQVMTKEQVDTAFNCMDDHILEYLGSENYSIELFGGEPLQPHTKDIVQYIIEKATHKGKHITIITNGVNASLFEDVFKGHQNSIKFQITLDGIPEIHNKRRVFENGSGTFDIIARNTDKLIKDGFNVRVRVNTDCNNIQHMGELFNYFESLGWTQAPNFEGSVAPVTEHGCMPTCATISEFEIFTELIKVFPDFREVAKKYRVIISPDMLRIIGHMNKVCNPDSPGDNFLPSITYCEAAELQTIGMGPDGYIYVCGETYGVKEYSVGQYYPEYELNTEIISKWKNRTIFNIDKCSKCNIATFCGGGCPFAALKFNGSPDSHFCGHTRETIDKFLNHNTGRFIEMAGV